MRPIKHSAKVLEIIDETPTVKRILLSVPDEFSFDHGQFITVIIGDQRRSYSIARADDGWIEICLNKVQDGRVSPKIHDMKVNDVINFIGPLGVFVLKQDAPQKENIFVATGTGVTPFVSMISSLLKNTKKKVYLLAGYKTENEVLYDSFFKEVQREYSNFEYHVIISQPQHKSTEQGRVQQLLEKHTPKDFSGDYYLCGLFDMIKDVGMMLTKQDVSKDRLIFERYD